MKNRKLAEQHVMFAVFVLACGLIFWKTWAALIEYSLQNESASHILIIPIVALCLSFLERKTVFQKSSPALLSGLAVVVVAIAIFWLSTRLRGTGNDRLSLDVLALVTLLIAGFITCYGLNVARAALFPLLFLLFMVPWPSVILNHVILWLQEGSTDITYAIFKALGVPVFRSGFVLTVPGIAIEVASECSGIRSSMALLITCLLAGHLYLRSGWRILLLVLLVIPLSIIKNGIRIATLTLLSLYVDPGFLKGSLHRDGGFVFFFLALAIIYPIFLLLEKTGKKRMPSSTGEGRQTANTPLSGSV